MGISRVEYDGKLLIDISSDTVNKSNLLVGATAHDSNGEEVVGECTYDMDTKNFTAFAEHILKDKTAGVNGKTVTGINSSAVSMLTPENIRENVEILGVTGSMTGTEGENCSPPITVEAPLDKDLNITPEGDYTCFKQVTVKKVPYNTVDKTADNKGIWVTIG